MAIIHEDLKSRVAVGLGSLNNLIDTTADGTLWSSTTTVATWQAVNNGEAAKAKYHETDKIIFTINNRIVSENNQQGIFTNTEITAANDTATAEAGYTDNDSTLSATYHGTRG